MKIAILTLQLHYNYGGNLKCYALCTVLKKMDHEVQVIKLIQDIQLPPLKQRPYLYTKRLINKILGRKYSCILAEQRLIKDRDIVHQYADEFIRKYIPCTNAQYASNEELKEISNLGFQVYIVGSDQVWRPKYAFPDIRAFYLSFLKKEKVKRIAYAASFGTDENEYTKEQQQDCGILIEKFDAVSVRESSAIKLINDTLLWNCKQLQQVVDPTMLLDKIDYLKLVNQQFPAPANGLFYYIIDMTSDKKRALDDICRKTQTTPFTVFPKSTLPDSKVEDKIVPPVEEWINAFEKAQYIITDSFHGCVFSIIFNKPFIVYANANRGVARFNSLLKLFHLKDRLIYSAQELNIEKINAPINWHQINQIRKEQTELAMLFLKKNLQVPQENVT